MEVYVMSVLAIFGHPDHNISKVNKAWFKACQESENITTHCLSAEYPTLEIDVQREQELLIEHDRIVLVFPLYWYSCPAIMKMWMDSVLLPGFAYGRGGDKLLGKELMVCTSIGSSESDYRAGSYNNFTVDEFLRPFQQTAAYIGARYLPAYYLFESMICSDIEVASSCANLIKKLNFDNKEIIKHHDDVVDKSINEFIQRMSEVS